MKKNILTSILAIFLLFSAEQIKAASDTTLIVVPDTTLDNIYYYHNNFTSPTIIVFPNLKSVSGYIYFDGNVNLVSVNLPLLSHTASDNVNPGYIYFSNNQQLNTINAPALTAIGGYLYVTGNTSLAHLNVCNIKSAQYFYITNNTPAVDATPFCFAVAPPTAITLSNDSIAENQVPGTFIGIVSATGNPGDSLTYSLGNNIFSNYPFTLRSDSLFSGQTFVYAAQHQYTIPLSVTNQLGESLTDSFTIYVKPAVSNDTVTIIIPDTTLSSLYYYHVNYTSPTKLVFPNLKLVNGYIYFDGNVNLVSVDLPVLDTTIQDNATRGYVYFSNNQQLKTINAPLLTRIDGYLYVSGNTSLTQLNVCDIKTAQYFYITNNTPAVDATPFCFAVTPPTAIALSNDSIAENQMPSTFIGIVSATGHIGDSLTYSLGINNIQPNYPFTLRGDSLFSARTFVYAAQNQYTIPLSVANQLGESLTDSFTIYIKPAPSTDTVTIIIPDTTLSSVYYYHGNYTSPTKLVFPNLKSVNGYVYFDNNVNLVSVDFPVLDTTIQDNANRGYVYFSNNQQLTTVNAPLLTKIDGYIYLSGNTSLTQLNVCNIKSAQYFYIANNTPTVDATPFCFAVPPPTAIALSNDSIAENQVPGTFIGIVSATGNTGDVLSYSLGNNIISNYPFTVRGDSLFSTRTFVYSAQNQYTIPLSVTDQLGESLTDSFTIFVTPANILPTIPMTLYASYEYLDSTGWTQYYNDNGTPTDFSDDIHLLSLNKNGQNIGTIGDGTFSVKIQATAGAGSGNAVQVTNNTLTNTGVFLAMNRYWIVTPTYEPTADVGVRFYYNNQDLVDVNGSDSLHNLTNQDLVFYKAIGGNPDPTTNLTGVDSVINISPSATTASDTSWTYHQLTDSTQYAEFSVASFSGGSGGYAAKGQAVVPTAGFNVKIYPNPTTANGYVNIELSGLSTYAIVKIYDCLGQLIWTRDLVNGSNTISLITLTRGAYNLVIVDGNGNKVTKRMVIK
jgi:hypothetical protein